MIFGVIQRTGKFNRPLHTYRYQFLVVGLAQLVHVLVTPFGKII